MTRVTKKLTKEALTVLQNWNNDIIQNVYHTMISYKMCSRQKGDINDSKTEVFSQQN